MNRTAGCFPCHQRYWLKAEILWQTLGVSTPRKSQYVFLRHLDWVFYRDPPSQKGQQLFLQVAIGPWTSLVLEVA